jgi:hypothetical protein
LEELKQAGSCHLPLSITLGAMLLWKYKVFLEKLKVASKKKAHEDKCLQEAMNGYEAAVGMQATRAPDNIQLNCTTCTVTPTPRVGTTADTPAVIRLWPASVTRFQAVSKQLTP